MAAGERRGNRSPLGVGRQRITAVTLPPYSTGARPERMTSKTAPSAAGISVLMPISSAVLPAAWAARPSELP
ncbi:hypothetical protein P4050_16590 [Pseudomonas aeruginosa]|nr:hypothetical protein [Pseudomonas aeruginosa]